MNFSRIVLSVILLSAVARSASAGPIENFFPAPNVTVGLRDVIDTVERSTREMSGVSADFFQRSTIGRDQREMRASGEMFLRLAQGQPVMFRFNYFRPAKQEIVCNGRNLWIYLPENGQVIFSDVSFAFQPGSFDWDHRTSGRATNFIQGLGQISKDFFINFASEDKDIEGNYVLELEPRRPTAFISKLFMVVDRHAVVDSLKGGNGLNRNGFREKLFPILSTTVIDHQGNTTTLELSNIRADSFMMPDLFDFNIPPGVNVVKPPRGPAK